MKKEYVMMERTVREENLKLNYRIAAIVAENRILEYLVSVKFMEEQKSVSFQNLFEAVRVFTKISEGAVTPCTLYDVVSDMEFDQISEKPFTFSEKCDKI